MMIIEKGPVIDIQFHSRKRLIEFDLLGYEDATNVYVAGDFTCWFPGAYPMKRINSKWQLVLPFYEGIYKYAYVIDGYEWIADPDNPNSCKNSFGKPCSLLVIEPDSNDIFYHDQTSTFLDIDDDIIHIKVRIKKDSVKEPKIILKSGDKVDEYALQYFWDDAFFDYLEVYLSTKDYLHSKYFFVFDHSGSRYYYSESGVSLNISDIKPFKFVNLQNIFDVPKWAKGAIFYQIFVDRFYNKERINKKQWYDKPTRDNFFGGNLEGILDKLDYLSDLGIDAIYLTPIFKSKSNHKYDIYDYYDIDPAFGDKQILKTLVTNAHKKNIRIILDGVFHHTSDEFFAFKDVIVNKQKSKYLNWYFIRRRHDSFPYYETFLGVKNMPKLNLLNKTTSEYFLSVGEYWTRYFDIDGWRLDVAHGIPHNFLKLFRNRMKKIKSIYIVGEFFNDESNSLYLWINQDELDAIMNYPLRAAIINFVSGNISGYEFFKKIGELKAKIPRKSLLAMYNMLSSHDTPRIITVFNNDLSKVKLAIFLQMTLPGAPAIYYGDEVGLEGSDDPDNRRTMIWDQSRWNFEIFNYYKKLIELRKRYLSLKYGTISFKLIDDNNKLLIYERSYNNETISVLINYNTVKKEYKLDRSYKELFPNEQDQVNNTITINPKSGIILANM